MTLTQVISEAEKLAEAGKYQEAIEILNKTLEGIMDETKHTLEYLKLMIILEFIFLNKLEEPMI